MRQCYSTVFFNFLLLFSSRLPIDWISRDIALKNSYPFVTSIKRFDIFAARVPLNGLLPWFLLAAPRFMSTHRCENTFKQFYNHLLTWRGVSETQLERLYGVVDASLSSASAWSTGNYSRADRCGSWVQSSPREHSSTMAYTLAYPDVGTVGDFNSILYLQIFFSLVCTKHCPSSPRRH